MTVLLDTWSTEKAEEDGMTDEHTWIWRQMIAATALPKGDFSRVLDIGCNQGGFLRMLYDQTPFAKGVGVDLAQDAVAMAEARKGDRPLSYIASTDLKDAGGGFDIAYSHEVIYLIRDLKDHARQVRDVLRPGATYHAVTCCHADSPLYAGWREKIGGFSKIPVPNHSITDISTAFLKEGFQVTASRFLANAAIPLEGPSDYFPSDAARLDTYATWKIMFHCTLPA